MAGKKVLITGGAGFIDSYVVDRLVEGGCDVAVNHEGNAACDFINNENRVIYELSDKGIAEKVFMGLDRRKDLVDRCVECAKAYNSDEIVNSIEYFYGKRGEI